MVRPLLIISKPTPATLIRDRDDRGHPNHLSSGINGGNLDKNNLYNKFNLAKHILHLEGINGSESPPCVVRQRHSSWSRR